MGLAAGAFAIASILGVYPNTPGEPDGLILMVGFREGRLLQAYGSDGNAAWTDKHNLSAVDVIELASDGSALVSPAGQPTRSSG